MSEVAMELDPRTEILRVVENQGSRVLGHMDALIEDLRIGLGDEFPEVLGVVTDTRRRIERVFEARR